MDARELAGRSWARFGELLGTLDEVDLVRPSRCAGWVVVDVAAHLLGDVQRCLVACATPTEDAPTVDAVSYWSAWAGDVDALSTARGFRWQRLQASAYRGPEGLRAQWDDLAPAASRALAARRPDERLRTQGHVVTAAELARTFVVETVVHHLDCLLDLPERARPLPEALGAVAAVYGHACGVAVPATEEWALKGAGRLPLDDADRALLGEAASRFPLLG